MPISHWIRRQAQYLVAKRRGEGAILCRADLGRRFLCGARLTGANLTEADLRGACLEEADLSRAQLDRAVVVGADLRSARLVGAQLRGADLSGAVLLNAALRGADLAHAALREADLRRTDLRDANLADADLSRAGIAGADLSGADLSGALLRGAHFDSAAKWPAGVDPCSRGAISIPSLVALIVTGDPDPGYVPVLRETLLAEGFAAVVVCDRFPRLGDSGLQLDQDGLPEPWQVGILILDDSLGVPPAVDFRAQVRQSPDATEIRISVFIRDERDEVYFEFMRSGCDWSAPKPIDSREVRTFLRRCDIVARSAGLRTGTP